MGLVRRALAPAKAATGPGVWSMMTNASLASRATHPLKLAAEAQTIGRTNVWVAAAERAINGRLARVAYHLERADGETVTPDNATPAEQAVLTLIEKPNDAQRQASTRRRLWGLVGRHTGLCGWSFLYLDQRLLLAGTPLHTLYINPVRMSAATDAAGNLIGWVLDAPDNPVTGTPGKPGVPIALDEVEQVVLDEPDSGHYGLGVVESAWTKIKLSELTDSHTAQVLSTGGRLAGLMSPKDRDGSLNEDQWDATIRAWRQIVDDPESAKRLHIVRMPVEFTATAASPQEMELGAMMLMGRDDTLAAWGVPGSQLGIMSARGLNSGETVKYEEAALWQGAIEPRASALVEVLQRIVDRFELGLKLVLETPSFDDDAPLYENAQKASVIPLTVNQRLEMVGRDPLDPAQYGTFGEAIFIDQSMVRVDPAGVAKKQQVALAIAEGQQPEEDDEEPVPPKGSLEDDLLAIRTRISGDVTPEMQKRLLAVLADMRDEIGDRVERHRDHLTANPSDSRVWWDESRWRSALNEAIAPAAQMVPEVAHAQSARFNAAPAKADEWIERVMQYVRGRSLDRVTGMLKTTKDAVQRALSAGTKEGLPANELAAAVRESAGLDEYRAELIARTEVMSAYNDASLRTFREFGAERVIADDGDTDAECAARNGQEYSISEADGIGDHPNGTLTWIPVP